MIIYLTNWSQYRNILIKDISQTNSDNTVKLIGWISSKRIHGKKIFMTLRDQSGFIQCVCSKDNVPNVFNDLTTISIESAIGLEGNVIEDKRAPQGVEIHITNLEIIASSDIWPLTQSAIKNPGFMFDNRHLSIRGKRSRAIMVIRNQLIKSTHEFFENNDYVFIQAPSFITSAVEGGSSLFTVKYFDETVFLSQSSQFYEEAAICVFEKVYVIQPSFRSEKSRTRKHLTEFWHIEAEAAFTTHEDIMKLEENLVHYIISKIHEKNKTELETLGISNLSIPETPFQKIVYDEAIDILTKKGIKIDWGDDFGAEAEYVLSSEFQDPFFIKNFPTKCRSFYHMSPEKNPEITLSSDLIAPNGYGEITSGGQRIHDLNTLIKKIQDQNLNPKEYQWYIDLRKYGLPPHSGFGLGVERMIRWLLNLDHVRSSILFPRTPSRLYP